MGVAHGSEEKYNFMARYTGPTKKYMRRFKMIEEEHKRPKMSMRKQSQYGISLDQKQKLKFIYGVLEKQFRRYYEEALRKEGNTEELFVQQLETRLDNVVYRLGIARTRAQARQLVTHGHLQVDGKKVSIPSYLVKKGQTVSLRPKSVDLNLVKESLEETKNLTLAKWLERKGPAGKIAALPTLEDVQLEVDVSLIIEYYSR